MNESMTEARFRALAEAYGSAFERWPAGERNAARELLLKKPELRAALLAEAELDRWLAGSAEAGVPPSLLSRLDAVPERAQPFPVRPRALLVPAVGWAFAAAFGLWLGTAIEEPELSADASAEIEGEPSVIELAAGDFENFEEAQ